jgi:hypothetical protein
VVAEDLLALCQAEMGPSIVAVKKAILAWAGQEQAGSVQLLSFLVKGTSRWARGGRRAGRRCAGLGVGPNTVAVPGAQLAAVAKVWSVLQPACVSRRRPLCLPSAPPARPALRLAAPLPPRPTTFPALPLRRWRELLPSYPDDQAPEAQALLVSLHKAATILKQHALSQRYAHVLDAALASELLPAEVAAEVEAARQLTEEQVQLAASVAAEVQVGGGVRRPAPAAQLVRRAAP